MTFSVILGVTETLCSFRLVIKGKTGKEIPKSSRFKFLEKFLESFQEPGFWKKIDSFVLLAIVSLAASRTLLQ